MVERIEWSERAEHIFMCILEFYALRNGNKIYSRKLNNQIHRTIDLLKKNPLLGKKTDIENVRVVFKSDYHVHYKVSDKILRILLIWDGRQNPKSLTIDSN